MTRLSRESPIDAHGVLDETRWGVTVTRQLAADWRQTRASVACDACAASNGRRARVSARRRIDAYGARRRRPASI